MAPEAVHPAQLAGSEDVEEFIDKVSEVSRLIDCLKEGTISPEYVDRKMAAKAAAAAAAAKPPAAQLTGPGDTRVRPDKDAKDAPPSAEEAAQRQADLQRKVEEIRSNLERKRRARERYQAYVTKASNAAGTDYNKWDMWCPSDEEDDMINSLTPNSPEFRSMEKDINERHKRMVEQRQIAERERVKGNDLFKEKRFGEAYQCYEIGLSHEKTNMALHANAAMASIKMKCFVQAVAHCDKVLSIAEFLHNNKKDALCAKALHRRATAYKALQQVPRAVEDLKAALHIEPTNPEITKDLAATERELEQHNKQKNIAKLAKQACQDVPAAKLQPLLQKLQAVEKGVNTCSSALAELAGMAADAPKPRGGLSSLKKATAPRWSVVKQAAKELVECLHADDNACIYFREVGGITTVSSLMLEATQAAAAAAAATPACQQLLLVLETACLNDANAVSISQDSSFVAACLNFLQMLLHTQHNHLASPAVSLLCSLASVEAARKHVAVSLCSKPAGQSADPDKFSGTQPYALRCVTTSLTTADPTLKVQLLTLLGNCSVERVVQQNLRGLVVETTFLEDLACMIASKEPLQAQKALVLTGNLCSDAHLRAKLAVPDTGIVAALLPLAIPVASTSAAASVQLAALSTLYNLTLEGNAAEQLTEQHVAQLVAQLGKESATSSQLLHRTVAVLSRVTKVAELQAAVQTGTQVAELLKVLQCVSADWAEAGKQQQNKETLQTIEHLVRVVTRCISAAPPECIASALAAAGIDTLLGLTAAEYDQSTSVQGNAALALAAFASHSACLPRLHKLAAVAKLLRIAYAGKGNASSKNAAIALARMAHYPAMLESLRELHGLEIIYQYVKP